MQEEEEKRQMQRETKSELQRKIFSLYGNMKGEGNEVKGEAAVHKQA